MFFIVWFMNRSRVFVLSLAHTHTFSVWINFYVFDWVVRLVLGRSFALSISSGLIKCTGSGTTCASVSFLERGLDKICTVHPCLTPRSPRSLGPRCWDVLTVRLLKSTSQAHTTLLHARLTYPNSFLEHSLVQSGIMIGFHQSLISYLFFLPRYRQVKLG